MIENNIWFRTFRIIVLIQAITICLIVILSTTNYKWQKQAIDNGAARYNNVTGKFEWIKHKE